MIINDKNFGFMVFSFSYCSIKGNIKVESIVISQFGKSGVLQPLLYKVINAAAVETKAANHRHIIVAITSYNGS